MSRRVLLSCLALAGLLCTGCGGKDAAADEAPAILNEPLPRVGVEAALPIEVPVEELSTEEETEMQTIHLKINDTEVSVQWEDNDSVTALKGLLENGAKEIQMSMYGGFEQVGSLGQSLTRHDVQTVTEAGDIVLYSGNSIVVFYGSNSWAYTRLGKIADRTQQELAELLSNGDVTLTLELKS